MISSKLKKSLEVMHKSQKCPSVLLITGLYEQESKEARLKSVAETLEGKTVSKAQGNLLVLAPGNETSIKVDEVRELLSQISLQNWDSNGGRYVLIPQAELLTPQSSNALLKSLEEAPEGTYFILGAPSKRSLLRTILSRSFVLSDEPEISELKPDNAFQTALFGKDMSFLLGLTKSDLRNEWTQFQASVKEEFVERTYSGELERDKWFKLFDFMEGLERKIDANMDVKWLAHSIERFDF